MTGSVATPGWFQAAPRGSGRELCGQRKPTLDAGPPPVSNYLVCWGLLSQGSGESWGWRTRLLQVTSPPHIRTLKGAELMVGSQQTPAHPPHSSGWVSSHGLWNLKAETVVQNPSPARLTCIIYAPTNTHTETIYTHPDIHTCTLLTTTHTPTQQYTHTSTHTHGFLTITHTPINTYSYIQTHTHAPNHYTHTIHTPNHKTCTIYTHPYTHTHTYTSRCGRWQTSRSCSIEPVFSCRKTDKQHK